MDDKGLHGHSKVIKPQLNMSSSAKCGLNKQFNKSYMIIFANIYTIIVTLHGISGNKVNARTRHARTLKQKNPLLTR